MSDCVDGRRTNSKTQKLVLIWLRTVECGDAFSLSWTGDALLRLCSLICMREITTLTALVLPVCVPDRCAVCHMQSSDVLWSQPELSIPGIHRHQLSGGSRWLHFHTGRPPICLSFIQLSVATLSSSWNMHTLWTFAFFTLQPETSMCLIGTLCDRPTQRSLSQSKGCH